MRNDRSPSNGNRARILRFRHRRSDELNKAATPVDDLRRYERDGAPDDYRHRMLVNAAAAIVVALLIGAGLWIANTMADLRKNQDCALQGRRDCAPVAIDRDRR